MNNQDKKAVLSPFYGISIKGIYASEGLIALLSEHAPSIDKDATVPLNSDLSSLAALAIHLSDFK